MCGTDITVISMIDKAIDILTRTLWGEARGEPDKGLIAVAWTIRNRADDPKWWGSNIETVCLKPKQFSCWNKGDPNYPYLMGLRSIPARDYVRMREAAISVIDGHQSDPTGGATHYHAKSMRNYPGWTLGATMTVVIGGHVFYRDVP